MALIFSEPGNPASELLELRCSCCRETKPMKHFPASCAVYRRGACRSCNALKARNKCSDPLSRKLESARVRYRRLGSVKVDDIATLYARFGFDSSNEEHLRHTWVSKLNDEKPVTAENLTLKWRHSHCPARTMHSHVPAT
jgi:hypothetical protein